MVWAAALYAIAGSLIIQKVGHPLVSINYQLQRVEADFRFGLIRVRENAEQIAFYDGIGTENRQRQDDLRAHPRQLVDVMKYTRRMTFVLSFYGQIAIIFPIMVAAPRYFAGAFSFGVLMQISSAFGTVSDSFSWFINSYSTLVEWRATVNRLREFKRVMRSTHIREAISPATAHGGINLHYTDTNALTTSGLVARAAERDAACASRGCLDRARVALARAWAVGIGQEHADARARRALAVRRRHDRRTRRREDDVHPAAELPADRHAEGGAGVSSPGGTFSDEESREVLRACNLADYGDRLEQLGHWAKMLSPGEQQRLAAARVLLHKPDFVFLDEATSALDADNELHIYNTLVERLPNAAMLSVAHRDSVAMFHDYKIEIERAMAEV